MPARLGQTDGHLGAPQRDRRAATGPRPTGSARPTLGPRSTPSSPGSRPSSPAKVLRDPDDLTRRIDDPEGLAWGLIGVEGFDHLIRTESDLARLPDLLRRGVRLFQPTYTSSSLLAGSSGDRDDRGLLDLGRYFLESLAEPSGEAARGRSSTSPT